MDVTVTRIPTRYLFDPIDEDLSEKMVFISGPRQVGKTTLALKLVRAASTGSLSLPSRSRLASAL